MEWITVGSGSNACIPLTNRSST